MIQYQPFTPQSIKKFLKDFLSKENGENGNKRISWQISLQSRYFSWSLNWLISCNSSIIIQYENCYSLSVRYFDIQTVVRTTIQHQWTGMVWVGCGSNKSQSILKYTLLQETSSPGIGLRLDIGRPVLCTMPRSNSQWWLSTCYIYLEKRNEVNIFRVKL